MTFKKYISLTRAGILDSLQFRLALVMTVLGNLLYLLLIYNLWNSIYASVDSAKINGMTFADTMIYLVFASALFTAVLYALSDFAFSYAFLASSLSSFASPSMYA